MLRRLWLKVRFLKLRGFTLTELLVALIVSSLVLTLLLAFTVTLTRTNQEEDAKAASQDEVTAALNFIANDLQEAVFIYGATGLERNSTDTPRGIRDQIYRPTSLSANQMRPVLVFWKRKFRGPNEPIKEGQKIVRCLGYNRPSDPNETTCFGQARFIFSLVSYHLVRDNSATWSPSARIVRHEVTDGVRWSCASPPNCPPRLDRNGNAWTTGTDYEIPPDPGFRLFDITGAGTFEARMNRWTRDGNYDGNRNPIRVLIDHVDDIPGTRNVFGEAQRMANFLQLPDCNSAETGLQPGLGASLVPTIDFTLGEAEGVRALSSFYACVANFGSPSRSLARVWLRGNYSSRVTPDRNFRQVGNPLAGTTTSDITVLARGIFKTEN